MTNDLKILLIARIASLLSSSRHVAVGASSPLPSAAALLAQLQNPKLRVSLLGSESHSDFTDGGRELFDCAAQGRIDHFFFSGLQIDGEANINLVGAGNYPQMTQRISGSFGSAYLYHQVPSVILFCWAHSVRSLVKRVDFISAAGPRHDGVWRRGGPVVLLTDRCEFIYRPTVEKNPVMLDAAAFASAAASGNSGRDSTAAPAAGKFELKSLHPGESLEGIVENTDFEFKQPDKAKVPVTNSDALSDGTAELLMNKVLPELASAYPRFVDRFMND